MKNNICLYKVTFFGNEKYILPIGGGCLVITDHTDHQNSQDVDTNPVGDIQTIENLPTQMNHHH